MINMCAMYCSSLTDCPSKPKQLLKFELAGNLGGQFVNFCMYVSFSMRLLCIKVYAYHQHN